MGHITGEIRPLVPIAQLFAIHLTVNKTSSRRAVVWTLRCAALALGVVGLGGTVYKAFEQLAGYEWQVRPAWLLLSGALYALGLAPMAWFWHRTLGALGMRAPVLATFRAYYLGHLGKYVPGKAMSVILRVAAVNKWVISMRLALLSCLMETLTMMAVGASLSALLTLVLLRSEPYLAAVAAAFAVGSLISTLPPVARRLARIGVDRLKARDEVTTAKMSPAEIDDHLRGIDYRLLFSGWCAAGVCWLMLGLSMWATLRAIGAENVSPFVDLPRLVATTAFAVVAGFASLLPGGIVVRDVVLLRLLAPICGEPSALVAAVLVRLVWLVSELLACGILYIGSAKRR